MAMLIFFPLLNTLTKESGPKLAIVGDAAPKIDNTFFPNIDTQLCIYLF